ncbi:MAG TPA: WYL domain-containing protein [Polyangia bacterium]|nr:WYL domain-containing protein [Polyangia bacterium]
MSGPIPAQVAARKTERLLDLLVLLLNADRPLRFAEIRQQFRDYNTRNPESGARAFERDKKELTLLGVPLRCIHAGEPWPPGGEEELDEDGYVIDREQYLLPELSLARAEIAALVVVAEVARAQTGFPYQEEIDSALRKITFDADAPEPAPDLRIDLPTQLSGRAATRILRRLEEAVHARKRVTLRYRKPGAAKTEARTVDPYGLAYRRGSWMLVGFDHGRRDVRSFRVDRCTQVKVAGRPAEPDFERPPGLDVRALALRSPWTFEIEPRGRVVLEAAPELAHVAHEDFGADATRSPLPSGGVRIEFACGNPAYLVTRVLAAAGRLRVLAPETQRRRVRAAAQAAAARYRS